MVVKKFKDIAKDDIHLAGEKMKLQDIIDKPLVVTGYKITKSKFKEDNYVAIQYDMDGEQHVTFTGAQVLIEQLKIENPLEKHICQNPRSIHKQLN